MYQLIIEDSFRKAYSKLTRAEQEVADRKLTLFVVANRIATLTHSNKSVFGIALTISMQYRTRARIA